MEKTGTDSSDGNKIDKPRRQKLSVAVSVIAVIAIVVIVVLTVVIINLLNVKPAPPIVIEKSYGGKGVVATQENIDEILEQMNTPVKDGYYEVTMNSDWVFETAKSPSSNAYVKNKETNTRTVYFAVFLSDTGELVYTSPYLPLGSSLTNFALDKELEAGEYPAVMTYYLVDDDYNKLTDVSITVKLKIES
jgi:hypothetical protein